MNKKLATKIEVLPNKPGAYLFKDAGGRILYVGKAINLKSRVRSHFVKGTTFYRKEWITNIADIDHIKTANEKQALLLENQLIKKYQPRYNIQWRDDKSYFWVEITNEQWPRVQIVHKRQVTSKQETSKKIGPFVNGTELKQVLRALRKIFPYRTCKNSYNKPCLQWHLGLCPAHKPINKKQLTINNYLNSLNAMKQFLRLYAGEPIRIEAYDISNIHGAHATGSMIVFAGDKPKKSDWRRFRVKNVRGANDVAMLKEVLRRRLNHPEWPLPELIIIDGGKAQLNAAIATTDHRLPTTAIIALAKQQEEIYTKYSKKTLKLHSLPISLRLTFQAIRNEAHRFAIFYYRRLHRNRLKTQNHNLKLKARDRKI